MGYMQLSKAWRLEQKGGELYVMGGHDAIFTLDIADGRRSFFSELDHSTKFKSDELSSDDQLILEQLLSAGVITPTLQKTKSAKPIIKIVGTLPDFKLNSSKFSQIDKGKCDLLVLVRTDETLAGFIDEISYLEIVRPHIFLDLAYEHTISLGPLVFPGQTACVACLKGRIETRWGDQAPPPEARGVNELSRLALDWLSLELRNIFENEDYFLVNKTLVMDMQSRKFNANKLHTVPLCPFCRKNELLASGKLEYNLPKG